MGDMSAALMQAAMQGAQMTYDGANSLAQMDYNSHEAGKTREHDMNMLNTSYQRAMENWQSQFGQTNAEYDRRFGTQNAEWERRFGMENGEWTRRLLQGADTEYSQWLRTQSPTAIAQQARLAGIAPQALLGSMGANSGLSLPSVSSGSVGSPAAPTPSVSGGSSGSGTAASVGSLSHVDFAQGLSSLISAVGAYKKNSADADFTLKTLNDAARKLAGEAEFVDTQNKMQLMQNAVYKTYGDKQAASELMKTYYEAVLARVQGDTSKSQKLLNLCLSRVELLKGEKLSAELPLVVSVLESEIQANKSAAARNYADAAEARERAKVYPSQIEVNKALADFHRSGANLNSANTDRLRRLTPYEIDKFAKDLAGVDWDNRKRALETLRAYKFYDAPNNYFELFNYVTKTMDYNWQDQRIWKAFLTELKQMPVTTKEDYEHLNDEPMYEGPFRPYDEDSSYPKFYK